MTALVPEELLPFLRPAPPRCPTWPPSRPARRYVPL